MTQGGGVGDAACRSEPVEVPVGLVDHVEDAVAIEGEAEPLRRSRRRTRMASWSRSSRRRSRRAATGFGEGTGLRRGVGEVDHRRAWDRQSTVGDVDRGVRHGLREEVGRGEGDLAARSWWSPAMATRLSSGRRLGPALRPFRPRLAPFQSRRVTVMVVVDTPSAGNCRWAAPGAAGRCGRGGAASRHCLGPARCRQSCRWR